MAAGNKEAKVWLHDLSVTLNAGFPPHELSDILRHLRANRDALLAAWHEQIDVGDLRPRTVSFTATELVVTLADGRKIATPLDWYPKLAGAAQAQRANFELMAMGSHWPELDEDLSVAGMLKGQRG